MEQEHKQGVIYALLAYLMWGFFPIYWSFLKHISPLEILCHRVIWAFVFYTIIIAIRRRKWMLFIPQNKKQLKYLSFSACFIMFNWFVYIYGVNSGQILETSLGYFINPLITVAMGVLFLKEKLSVMQKIAFVLALIGVSIITYSKGGLPLIALSLAVSFSFYGLLKKLAPVEGFLSNQYESLVVLPIAFLILLMIPQLSENSIYPLKDGWLWGTSLLLICAGPVTALPLVCFAESARRLPMSILGFFQFLAPTIQFLSGVFFFEEPLEQTQLVGFCFIWCAAISVVLAKKNFKPAS